jgi:hypothetical protein
MPIDATVIQNPGWRQGSVFTIQASTPIIVANRERISVAQFTIADDSRHAAAQQGTTMATSRESAWRPQEQHKSLLRNLSTERRWVH